ncbi:hypothetical protein [Pseudoneobacillus sp. C159]
MNITKGIIGLSLAVVTLTGCGVVHGQDKTVIVSDNVAVRSSMDDAEVAVSKPLEINLKERMTYRELLGISNDQIYFTKNEGLFKTDLTSGKSVYIHDMPIKELSKDGSRALSVNSQGIFVYDVEGDKSIKLAGPTDYDVTFADPKGEYISYFDFNRSSYVFIHTSSTETKEVAMAKLFTLKDFSFNKASIRNNAIYLSVHQPKEGNAIYKITPDNKKELVLSLPHKEDQIARFDIIHDNLLVFNGTYNEESGIFFYRMDKQVIHKVVSGGKTSEGIWTPFYSISPDGSRMLFDESAPEGGKFYTNVYIANIEANQLTRSIRIIEKAELPAVIDLLAYWKGDSSAFYIPRSKKSISGYSDEIIEYLSKFEIDQIKAK